MRFGLFSDLHSNLPGLPERGYGGRSLEDLRRGLERVREAGGDFAVSLKKRTCRLRLTAWAWKKPLWDKTMSC